MKLSETSMQEIIDDFLWWENFDEDPNNREEIKKLIEKDPSAADKIMFLDDQETGTLLDRNSFRKLDFYEIEFTEFARLGIALGEYHEEGCARSKEVDYLKDYSDLRLLIQDVSISPSRDAVYALYLKDYAFGYIKPLGICIYDYELTDEMLKLREHNPQAFIRDHILLYLENALWDEELDLKQELFDYYHNIPEGIPFVDRLMNAEGLLSVQEAADMLGVSKARIKKMVADKVIEGFKYDGKLLISESSVQQRIDYIEKMGKPTRGKKPTNKTARRKKHADGTDE